VNDALPSHALVRFGVFELDTESGELRKQGVKVRLQEQPFQILQVLLEHPGRVVTREELQQRIWPSDTFVDFDRGLYNAIKRLRDALGDSAENPRFIETLSRRGYRFIAAVNGNGGAATERPQITAARPAASHKLRVSMWLLMVAAVLLVAAMGARRFWRRSPTQGTIPQIRSIAVLPLQNLSADANQEYLCDGLTDGLITDLAQIDSLKVISHTSTMQYKDTKKSLPEIARELNVDGIVEGMVQRSGDRVRVTAQLIYAPEDKHLWANSYERDMQDVFLLERDVAGDIAHQVQARVTAQDQTSSASLRTVNPKALEAYLQGNYYRSRLGRGSGDKAARTGAAYFQQAIDLDPSFVPAYLGLSWAHSYLLWPSRQDAEADREAVERAVALDPSSSEAHQYLGGIKLMAWDWAGAEQEYRRAIALSANNSEAHESLGHLLSITGRLDEGWREQQIAQELDPDHDHLSEGLALRRQYDREIAHLQIMLKRDPDDGYRHLALYPVYLKTGMYREAIQQLERAIILFGYPQEAAQVRRAFAVSGHRAAIREFARALEHLMATGQVFAPVNIAEAYAILGEKDRAFYWLEQAYARHDIGRSSTDVGMDALKSELLFDPIRSDPRFEDLLRRIGLPP
jgi:TolB-like protein/DNA-binding winged helix-turn-helix (wHTH) protein